MRWTSAQLEAEPPAKRAAFRWLEYIERHGAADLPERKAELQALVTPPNKDENAARRESAQRIRAHISALEALIYPRDEGAPEVESDG